MWRNDNKNGEGVIIYYNGDVFRGNWEEDTILGDSCFMAYKNGDTYQGSFKGGVKVGQGKYIFHTGQVIEA